MKLHLGCGKVYIPGFVHIDCVPYPHIDHVCQVDSLPIQENSVDLIYSCHVLEHFNRQEVPKVLKEWCRVIRKGGVCRISVPDFQALCTIYNKRLNLQEIIGPIFGRQDYLYNIHHNVFDYATLMRELMDAGFEEVRMYDWRKTEHAGIDDYSQAYIPHMDKENGTQISLNVEAVK